MIEASNKINVNATVELKKIFSIIYMMIAGTMAGQH